MQAETVMEIAMFELLRKHKKESFLRRLSLILWICIFIPFCAVIVVYSVSLALTHKNDIENTYKNNLTNFCLNFDKLLSSSVKKLDFVFNYDPLAQILNLSEKQRTLDMVTTSLDMDITFEALLNDNYTMELKIYSDNTKLYLPKYFDSMDKLSQKPYFSVLEQLDKSETFYTVQGNGTKKLYIYRKYNRINKGFAVVELSVPCSQINKLIDESNSEQASIFWEYNGTVYDITTWEIPDKLPAPKNTLISNHIQENNSDAYISLHPGLYLPVYTTITLITAIVISLLAVILILLTKLVAWSLSQKLYKVTDIIQDDTLQSLDTEDIDNDEFGMILRKLLEFYNELKEKNEQEKQITKQLSQLKIDILQERISPHFLYNTLASIKWIYPDRRLGEIIDSIVHYYRLMLNSGSSITTIENELQGISEYLKIQSFAYAKKVDVSIECPTNLKNHKIMKNLIQPIIENAFLHGINLSEEDGKIYVSVFETDNDIMFRISNTGPVISEEKTLEINSLTDCESTTHSRLGYALKNIINRMNIYYGNQSGIRAAVEDDMTVFEIRIPKKHSDEQVKENQNDEESFNS